MKIEIEVTLIKTTAEGVDFSEAVRKSSRRLFLISEKYRKNCTVLLVAGYIGNSKDNLFISVAGIERAEDKTPFPKMKREDYFCRKGIEAKKVVEIITEEQFLALELTDREKQEIENLNFY